MAYYHFLFHETVTEALSRNRLRKARPALMAWMTRSPVFMPLA